MSSYSSGLPTGPTNRVSWDSPVERMFAPGTRTGAFVTGSGPEVVIAVSRTVFYLISKRNSPTKATSVRRTIALAVYPDASETMHTQRRNSPTWQDHRTRACTGANA